MRTKVVPASEWNEALQNRWKVREALKKVEELKRLGERRERLIRELERRLYEEGYDERDLYLHGDSGNVMSPDARRAVAEGRCVSCGTKFYRGQEVVEFVEDDGTVIARYHRGCR